jgi:predicted RNase H-like nuclease (RuvC/YqgF family)
LEKASDKRLIVGLDPGTTCGVAVIGLDMKPLLLTSFRGANRDDIVRAVSGVGQPILIACDVADPPGFVRKVASLFEASLFAPRRDMTSREKRRIVEEYFPSLVKGLDAHTMDALAAALKAFLAYRNKFESVEARLRRLLRPETLEEIRAGIIRGARLSQVISREIMGLEEEAKERIVKVYVQDKARAADQRPGDPRERLISLLRWENERLRAELGKLKAERDELERILKRRTAEEYGELRRDAAYRIREKEIADLRARLREAERRIEELSAKPSGEELQMPGELIALREIPSFTHEEVEKALTEAGESPYIILLNAAGGGPSTARRLAEAKPRVVVRCTEMSHQAEEVLAEYDIPVIPVSRLEVKYLRGKPVVEKRILEERIREYRRRRIDSMMDELLKSAGVNETG